jgi:hypothetical protein
MSVNRTLVNAAVFGLIGVLVSCGARESDNATSAAPATAVPTVAPPPRPTIVEVGPVTSEAAPTTAEPVADLSKVTVATSTLDQLGSGPLVRVLLPTTTMPYSDVATDGGGRIESDQSWGYGFSWEWTKTEPKTVGSDGTRTWETPDGLPINGDWSVWLSGPGPGDEFKLADYAIVLWTSGELTFSLFPSQPCPDRTAIEWSSLETGVIVSTGGLIVASIGLMPGVADCGVPGESITPAQLVDLLVGLVDCDVGGGKPAVCRPIKPPTPDERTKAIELLTYAPKSLEP